jgi:phage head maturation protease
MKTKPILPTRERRCAFSAVETRALTAAEKSAGYIGVLVGVIPLNTDSVTLRDRGLNNGQPFVERIAPKAFAEAADVIAVVGHTDDPLAAFARGGANLTLIETEKEIRWEALLPDTQAGRDLAELGAKKILRGTSFEFERGATDAWEKRSDGTAVRTVTKGNLVRVNPVLEPAYAESSLSVDLRARINRDCYFSTDVAYDPTATEETCYALDALGDKLDELTDALEYLRASSGGALTDYANRQVAESAAAVTELTAFLAANGAQVDPALASRAAEKLSEARKAPAKKDVAPVAISETPRESALRILTK